GGRILDLSRAAAEALGMLEAGLARVRITVLEGPAVADLRVQVGAFRDRANADRLARELRDLSGVVVASVGGLYRVQVPVRGNAKSPEALQKQLRRRGLDSVLVPAGSQPPRSKT
ncbi:MAG: SPOR domain-containing protein, partial [Thermoanaerobaculia bacterium]|nr:SPOR domain-containing protein [Thermoanaerobaculia bacterium]